MDSVIPHELFLTFIKFVHLNHFRISDSNTANCFIKCINIRFLYLTQASSTIAIGYDINIIKTCIHHIFLPDVFAMLNLTFLIIHLHWIQAFMTIRIHNEHWELFWLCPVQLRKHWSHVEVFVDASHHWPIARSGFSLALDDYQSILLWIHVYIRSDELLWHKYITSRHLFFSLIHCTLFLLLTCRHTLSFHDLIEICTTFDPNLLKSIHLYQCSLDILGNKVLHLR